MKTFAEVLAAVQESDREIREYADATSRFAYRVLDLLSSEVRGSGGRIDIDGSGRRDVDAGFLTFPVTITMPTGNTVHTGQTANFETKVRVRQLGEGQYALVSHDGKVSPVESEQAAAELFWADLGGYVESVRKETLGQDVQQAGGLTD